MKRYGAAGALMAIITLWTLVSCAGTTPAVPPANPGNPGTTVQRPVEVSNLAKEVQGFKKTSDAKALLAKIESKGVPQNLTSEDRIIYAGLLLADGRLADAQAQYQGALTADSRNKEALSGLALLAGAQSKKNEQKLYLEKLLGAYPQDQEGNALMGNAFLDEGNEERAAFYFNQALASGENALALMGLGMIKMNKDKVEDAETLLTRALKVDPNNDLALSLRSQSFAYQDKFGSAEADITKAIELNPSSPYHYLDRGFIRIQVRNFQGAVKDLDQVLALDPKNFFAYVRRGEARQALENFPGAFEDFKSALALRPDYRPAYPQVAVLAFLGGDWELSAKMCSESAKQYKGEYAFPMTRALALKKAGKAAEAKATLETAIQTLPPQPLIQETLRFMMNPGADFTLNNLLTNEKDAVLKLRVEYYLALNNWVTGLKVPALNQLEGISNSKIKNVPEVGWARYMLQVLKS